MSLQQRASEVAYERVADCGDVSPGSAIVARVGGYDVAVFNLGDEFRAYENACPHQGGPIGEGIVDGATVTCPWHAWCFDLRSGKLTLGDFAQLRSFAVRADAEGIYVASEPGEDR